MAYLLSVKDTSVFNVEDDDLDSELLANAVSLSEKYKVWESDIFRILDSYEHQGFPYLTSRDVQMLFKLRDMHLAQMRVRGSIQAEKIDHEYHFTILSLRKLVESNSTVLEQDADRIHGPLMKSFLRWLESSSRTATLTESDTEDYNDSYPTAR